MRPICKLPTPQNPTPPASRRTQGCRRRYVGVFGAFYLDIAVDSVTDNVSVLGGETVGFLVEGDPERHAERVIIEWFALSLLVEEIVEDATSSA